MEQEIKQKIIKALDCYRGQFNMRDTKLLELIAETQGRERLDQILKDEKLLKALTNYYFTVPHYIFNFIAELSKMVNPRNHLDPWLTVLSPIIHNKFENAIGLCINKNEAELISHIFPELKAQLVVGDTFTELDKIGGPFDFISSFPPFGMRREPTQIAGIRTPADFSATLLLKASTLLTGNGKAVFLMAQSFLFDKTAKAAVKALSLCIEGIFSIPPGTYSPNSAIASNLVVISAKKREKTFVAELSADERSNKTILDNFKNHREGKAIQLGTFVDIDEFTSLQALISEKEMQEMIKRIGSPPILLIEIASQVNALKADNPDEVNHLPNSFYLPKVGNSPVVINPDSMRIKPKNYYQIQVDGDKALASYIVNYFNSHIGKKLRESMEIGTVIRQIPKSQLSNCILCLPDKTTQSELIDIDGKIEQFRIRLEELKRNLWKQPKNHKSIQKELKRINQEERLEHWIDTLPFPISSILWRYYATKENGKKVEHLFHFFEALSEFLSMIMLSAVVQDKEFYRQECHKWIDTDAKFKDWYLKANFGSWNILTSRLSKATREYLSDKDKQDQCKALYGNPTDAFLNILTSKRIVNILIEVAVLRNKYKGHGGITSEEDNKQKVITLEQLLYELRGIIADGFEDTRLLSPTTNIYEAGIFTYNAKELVGARTPFNEISIKSLIPLDIKKLYLAHKSQNKPVELLPFIKFVEISEACYFYTSIESKNVRWVSYHFDQNPEIIQPVDNDLFKAFEFLKSSQK